MPILPVLYAVPAFEKPVIGIVWLFRQPNTDADGGKYPKPTGSFCIVDALGCSYGRRLRGDFATRVEDGGLCAIPLMLEQRRILWPTHVYTRFFALH